MSGASEIPSRPVWARDDVAIETCPKSYVTAQSLGWMEQYFVWRRLAYRRPDELTARDVEAFMILENEMLLEGRRGRQ